MSAPHPDKSVSITRLKPGDHFDFNGTHGQLIEHMGEHVKVFLREKPQCRGGWKWREATWPKEMRVIPG